MEDVILGIRVSSAELDSVLRITFGEYVVDVDGVPAHYSVRFEEEPLTPSDRRDLHQLYEGSCLEKRSLDRGAIVQALIAALAVHRPPGDQEVRIRVTSLVDPENRVILLPDFARREVLKAERRLNSRGFRLVRPAAVRINLALGELVVGPPVVEPDWAVFSGRISTDGQDPSGVPAGRYPLHRWYLYQRGISMPGADLPLAVALGKAMESIGEVGAGLTRGEAWRLLAALIPRIDVVSSGEGDIRALLEAVL